MSRCPLFAFEGVRVERDGAPILDGVDLTLPEGGVTALVGPSGSGKSTLLRLCNRLEVPTAGRVRFRGDDLTQLDVLALRRRVGMVFQQPTPFGGTVADNLRVAAPRADDAALAAALGRAELAPVFLARQASDLSGGEAQRMCLARALVAEPEVLLMDEPTSALDEAPRRALERLARSLADGGVPVVWVSHDLEQVARLADRVVALDAGRVRSASPPVVQRPASMAPGERVDAPG